MTNPRKTATNAADSAPGVDDGPAGVAAPPVDSKPAGRVGVFLGVIVVCLIVLAAFLAPRMGGRNEGPMVTTGATEAEINTSQVPGAADRQAPNPSPMQQSGG